MSFSLFFKGLGRAVFYCSWAVVSFAIVPSSNVRLSLEELVLDLTQPEGMLRAARWLAEQLDMDPGAIAPGWDPLRDHETGTVVGWLLGTIQGGISFSAAHKGRTMIGGEWQDDIAIAEVPDDPAQALVLACLAVAELEGLLP